MTDAHFHRGGFGTWLVRDGRETAFYGVHPWQAADGTDVEAACAAVRARLASDLAAGVGEIGLDRLKTREVPAAQRALFAAQLALAADLGRPVVLHGAKCWGQVVAACRAHAGRIPAFLFHGFSRSAGLLPEIFALNGFVSVGPALLNDHAANYRALAKDLPLDRVLLETDEEWAEEAAHAARLAALLRKLAELRGCAETALAAAVAGNAARFAEARA